MRYLSVIALLCLAACQTPPPIYVLGCQIGDGVMMCVARPSTLPGGQP
jgi:hypothetical protein